MFFKVLSLFGLASLSLFAAPPVAKITSSDSFQLRGQTVRVGGVPSWPMMVGDDVATGESGATIEFRAGARVVLAASSKAKVEETKDGLAFRLLSGSMRILAGPATSVAFFSKGAAVQVNTTADTQVSLDTASKSSTVRKAAIALPPPPPTVSRK